ncbi:hypothetical protein [Burkholderia sp. Ac-20379]|uniref:hypothetical protein n=1 Tax=Burkholderia sp. Ac-20379 TaxID=2703900 RepID=UPI0019800BC3|nr:hypothetical protein [Burkholderia sp. Ac-20379]MBN3724005.1 hypothetical protein [Burkholderia sp. Ac-20379]
MDFGDLHRRIPSSTRRLKPSFRSPPIRSGVFIPTRNGPAAAHPMFPIATGSAFGFGTPEGVSRDA